MYADPYLIRQHNVKISFSGPEHDFVNAWVALSGEQKAAFLRRVILEAAQRDLASSLAANEGPQQALFGN